MILVAGMLFDIACTWKDAYRLMCGQRYGKKNTEKKVKWLTSIVGCSMGKNGMLTCVM